MKTTWFSLQVLVFLTCFLNCQFLLSRKLHLLGQRNLQNLHLMTGFIQLEFWKVRYVYIYMLLIVPHSPITESLSIDLTL